ncbi:MAG TPA: 16S rRNA (cytidine(1402)-2'-O)-methyltransferase [Kiritimatiellia bacterium]|jgi:16S rRNA (cytidine1402-2'-O)-methyltransferase|nr:16S rRNA (cytidine(1402)-2'-O)-methyltransferase [Kiritimatiellia bacterium]
MLYLVATPIGNLADLSPRALETLKSAQLIACEDTRRTWALLSAFNIPRPELISYRQGNEERAGERVLDVVRAGHTVALCSDGGYPGISDPGYRLIRRAVKEDVPFTVIPGASAVDLTLLASGLSTSSYTFKGFPPRKPGALQRFFEEEREQPHTLICFESPFRIAQTLKAAYQALGDREAAVCIELTKVHERVHRGYLSELIPLFDGKPVKGEVSLAFAGANPKFARPPDDSTE